MNHMLQSEHVENRPQPTVPILLTVQETCEALRISRWTFYQLVQRRQLRTVKIGRARRVEAAALVDYLGWLREHGAES